MAFRKSIRWAATACARGVPSGRALLLGAALIASLEGREARAETMESALAKAYVGNPDLNQQRANVWVHDEDVAKAAGGMRPKINASVNGGPQFNRLRQPAGRNSSNERLYSIEQTIGEPRAAAFALSQPLFDGWRTDNSIRQAESGVFAARATMRLTEQTTLQNAATAYMNVLRDTAVLGLRKNNIAVLREQLRVTRHRQELGELSPTDVAQAQAALAHAEMELNSAQAALEASAANFRQVIGVEPQHLEPAATIEQLLPKSSSEAIALALAEHPSVAAAQHQVDAAESAVKVGEGALLPTVSANLQVNQQYESFFGIPGTRQFTAQVSGALNVPIYQGGIEYASIRQAKAQLRQARFNADLQREAARAAVVSSFSQLKTAIGSIAAGRVAAKAAEVALKGVRDEAQLGQRTTLDVLNAQQALLNARVDLVTAQRDRIVASYTALAAVGHLSAERLRLETTIYDPAPHLEESRGKWFGLDGPGEK
ncbi:TolC family outer membrane protein [Methylosinus sporium]|uniref:TolC family outer membrane protein n=1 Tax=Methylosinus sporium TaxID=428 RepID=A0A549T485_METSR|nr:TolC family outer membrane protein [Methylosinus sporium]